MLPAQTSGDAFHACIWIVALSHEAGPGIVVESVGGGDLAHIDAVIEHGIATVGQ